MEPAFQARLRAALLALVVLVHGWIALPTPHKVTEAQLKGAQGREELRRWHGLLGQLGVDIGEAELGERVVTWSTWIADAKKASVRPIRPLLKLTGTGQGWALFSSPDTHPHRLEVHARVDGEWQLVYRRLDPAHAMLAEQLDYRRMRGIYDGGSVDGAYGALAEWAAARVLERMPHADAVRVQLVRTHSTRPGAPRDRKEIPRQVKIVERS